MRKTLSVAATTLKLLFRGGPGWGLLLLASAFAVFIFYSAGGGETLLDELRIRLEYALYASTTLLNLALIYFSCVSLRKEIDERRFHTISAAPVRRSEIWFGKFLGLLTLGVIAFLSISLSLAVVCLLFINGWTKPEETATLGTSFFRSYYRCTPDLSDLERQVSTLYAKRLKVLIARQEAKHRNEHKKAARDGESKGGSEARHHHHHHGEWEGDEWRARKRLLAEVRKSKQIIAPNSTAKWQFTWYPDSNQGTCVLLRFKFYSNRKRSQSKGLWSILDTKGRTLWSREFKGYPFIEHELSIPSDKMPKTSVFTLAYKEISPNFVIFPVYNNGLNIFYDNGGIFKNFCLLLLFTIAHMAVLVALSLMFSSMFSYSVAVFSAISLYAVGSFSSFFNHVLTDLSFHDQTLSTKLFSHLIQVGLWVAEGAKALPVNSWFANGVSIPLIKLLNDNAASFIIYIGVIVIIGTTILKRKEIDKILQA